MKSKKLTSFATIALLAVLALPVSLFAQDKQDHKHHHYQLIDLGTFGGPNSWFDSLSLTDSGGIHGR